MVMKSATVLTHDLQAWCLAEPLPGAQKMQYRATIVYQRMNGLAPHNGIRHNSAHIYHVSYGKKSPNKSSAP